MIRKGIEIKQAAPHFQSSSIDWNSRPDLSRRSNIVFRGDVTEPEKKVNWERFMQFIQNALKETIQARIAELKEERVNGTFHLLHLTSLPLPKHICVTSNLLHSPELVEQGIFVLDTEFFNGLITEAEEIKIFETSKLEDRVMLTMADAIRSKLLSLNRKSYLRSKSEGYQAPALGNEEFDLDVTMEELIIVDEREAFFRVDPRAFIHDPTYDLDAVHINFSKEQKAKFNEVLRVGRRRSQMNGILRLFDRVSGLE